MRDVVNITNNKFGTLKDSFKQAGLSASGIFDASTKTTYNNASIQTIYGYFNNTDTSINKDSASSVGASIFYDFFDPAIIPSGLIYGSPAASFGSGYSKAITYTQHSELNKASTPYYLYNILKIQRSLYPSS